MKKVLALILVLAMGLAMVGCGGPDKQPAIDAFNAANTAFTEVANAVNSGSVELDEEYVDILIELAGVMADFKEVLESDTDLTQEELDEIVVWCNDVEANMGEMKAALGME